MYTLPLIHWKLWIILITASRNCQAKKQQLLFQNQYRISSIVIDKFDVLAILICHKLVKDSSSIDALWYSSELRSRLLAVVDEPHCVCTWDKGYFWSHDVFGQLRSCTTSSTVFVVMTATVPKENLRDRTRNLRFSDDVPRTTTGPTSAWSPAASQPQRQHTSLCVPPHSCSGMALLYDDRVLQRTAFRPQSTLLQFVPEEDKKRFGCSHGINSSGYRRS